MDTPISNAGMKNLAALTRLRDLDLTFTKVGDAGLENLTALVRLRHLYLSGTAVTPAGEVTSGGAAEMRDYR